MAIAEHIPYRDASDFARVEDSTFYPVEIPVSHWQLRHYISAPEADHLFYASGHQVYCLNTVTRKRKHIASIPFDARCTASGYGWMCVGGGGDGEDYGHFAAIKIEGDGPRTADVDAPLPLEYGAADRESGGRRATSTKIERIGDAIVNSISIHRVQDEAAHLDDIVAVLTNNDKTVRVYSLPQSVETTVLDLPFAMNHATMSPDGAMMVAVGDVNQAYVFSREIQETPPQIPKPHNRLTSASVKWTLTSVVRLHVAGPDATLGYFTTAWSPCGRLVALGSEGGYITVLEVDILCDANSDDEDAVVAVIPSSRPDIPNSRPDMAIRNYPGAVRSMLFSPAPWDFLIWAEDQGRICIGDLRSSLRRKQVISLVPKDEKLTKEEYDDLPPDASPVMPRSIESLELDLMRNHRQGSASNTDINFATEYIEARARQREQRGLANLRQQINAATSGMRAAVEDDPQGLTAREQQILESLRTTRQREEARAQGQQPRSVNYTTPDMFVNHNRSSPAANEDSGTTSTRSSNDALAATIDALPELSRIHAQQARPSSAHGDSDDTAMPSLLPFHATQVGGARSNDNSISRLPRRRASVILSPPAPSTGAGSSASATTRRPTQSTTAAATTTDIQDADDDNPWRTIEDHMTLTRGPLFERLDRAEPTSPLPAPQRSTEDGIQVELAAERQRARLLARQRERWRNGGLASTTTAADRRLPTNFQDGYEALLRRAQMRGYSGTEARTAGLAMSADGRTLWAACEEGIFRFAINVKSRLFWPSVEMR
nr:uncharacterized protein c4g3.03 [Quercus suber]